MVRPCLSTDELQRCIAGEFADADSSEYLDHVERCETCQSTFVELCRTTPTAIARSTISEDEQRLLQRLRSQIPEIETAPSIPLIEGFQIDESLGQGGQAVVYLARQSRIRDRPVALKILGGGNRVLLRSELARFRNEFGAYARVEHPNVVRLYDVGEYKGLPYLVLEFVDGGTLRDKLDRERLTPRQTAELMATVARAVQAVHEQGIIHRDLKPRNILLTKDGVPKISDFGLARFTDSEAEITQTRDLLGTMEYMSPEQMSGHRALLGPSTDIYSLGVLLYELIGGRPPFVADNLSEFTTQLQTVAPISLRKLRPRVPRDIETICFKCLEKSPLQRFATAEALAEELDRFNRGETLSIRPVSRVKRVWRWSQRNPLRAITYVAAGLGVASLLVAITIGVASAARLIAQRPLRQLQRAVDDLHDSNRWRDATEEIRVRLSSSDIAVDEREYALALVSDSTTEARTHSLRSLEANPAHLGANLLLGWSSLLLGDIAQTERCVESARIIRPDETRTEFLQIALLTAQGQATEKDHSIDNLSHFAALGSTEAVRTVLDVLRQLSQIDRSLLKADFGGDAKERQEGVAELNRLQKLCDDVGKTLDPPQNDQPRLRYPIPPVIRRGLFHVATSVVDSRRLVDPSLTTEQSDAAFQRMQTAAAANPEGGTRFWSALAMQSRNLPGVTEKLDESIDSQWLLPLRNFALYFLIDGIWNEAGNNPANLTVELQRRLDRYADQYLTEPSPGVRFDAHCALHLARMNRHNRSEALLARIQLDQAAPNEQVEHARVQAEILVAIADGKLRNGDYVGAVNYAFKALEVLPEHSDAKAVLQRASTAGQNTIKKLLERIETGVKPTAPPASSTPEPAIAPAK